MELFGILAFALVLFLVLSGPIALIWCAVLSSRLNESERRRELLEYQFQKEREKEWRKLQVRTASPSVAQPAPKPDPTPEPVTEPLENVMVAMQRAKEQAVERIQKTDEKPLEKKETPPQFVPVPETKPPVVVAKEAEIKPTPTVPERPEPKPVPPPPEKKSDIFAPIPPPLLTSPPVPTISSSAKSEQPVVSAKPSQPVPKPKPLEEKSSQLPLAASHRPLDDLEWEKTHPTAPSKEGWQSVELWIGRYLLGWIAVAAFIVSAALFIIHAVNEGWIGRIPPSIRCMAIASFGGVFLVVGKYFHRIGWRRFSTMLSSAGVIIVFQAGYASFAYFELLSTQAAGVLMSLVVLGSFLLSWHYGSTLLGILSIVGGLAVPILISTGTDRYPEFFTYLAILNLGTVMLVNLLRRPPIGILAFVGTQAEFWLWHHEYYVEPVAPEKIVAVLLFQGVLYAIWLLDTSIAAMVPRTLLDFGATIRNALSADPHEKGDVTEKLPSPKIVTPSWDDAFRAVMAPIVLFGTVWWLLRNDPSYGPWLGIMAFIGAAWYALLAVLYTRHLARTRASSAYWKAGPAAATVIALSFLAVAIPLHFDAEWLALGWTTVFAGLWYFGHRQKNRTFLVLSVGFMALGVCRLLYDIFVQGFDPARLGEKAALLTAQPVLDVYVLPSLAAIFVALVSSVSVDRLLKARNREAERQRNFWLGLIGYGFLTMFLSVEAIRFFLYRPVLYLPTPHWASFSTTVLWSLAALALLETGVVFRSFLLRRTAQVALFVVAGKMILFDFFSRYQFETPLSNPFCPALIGCSLLLIAASAQSRISSRFDETEKPAWTALGITGIFTLLGILSVECFEYYLRNPIPLPVPLETVDDAIRQFFATEMLSVLWTVYAAVLFALGLTLKTKPLRICGLIVMILALVKIVAKELFYRPDFDAAYMNPYFLAMLCPAALLIVVGVWTVRFQPLEDETERDCFKTLGLGGLFLFMLIVSIECFFHFRTHLPNVVPEGDANRILFASASLSVLWAVFAVLLIVLGLSCRSFALRVFACGSLLAAMAKFAVLEMLHRPDYATAFLNPYALTILCPVVAAIFIAVWTIRFRPLENKQERDGFLALGLIGLAFLWIVLSIECFAHFYENPFLYFALGDSIMEWCRVQAAIASLSVLWTVFASILLVLGLSQRSATLRICALVVFAAALGKLFYLDSGFRYFVLNPYFVTAFWTPLLVMVFAVWTTRLKPLENEIERRCFLWFGLAGILFFGGVLSNECCLYFNPFSLKPLPPEAVAINRFTAAASLSVLWSVIASVLVALGIGWRSTYLRNFGQLVFVAVALKILVLEMFHRPAFETPILNPFFLPILIATLSMIASAVWTTKFRPLENNGERRSFLALGVVGIGLLWGAMSIECFDYFNIRTEWPDHRFLALASLTVFWTVLGILLAIIAARTDSKILRILAVLLIVLAFLKILPYELWERPAYLTPFLNPYAAPLGLLAFAMIFVCVGLISKLGNSDEFRTEKESYRLLAFIGVVLLWLVMSLECFKALRILQDAESEAWKAQMALSILWSLFAGVLIFVGFVWRSSVLRWMAILLFAVTLTKVMIVDMAGVHQMYRFGAVFVLAVVLSLAAWAYQRFRPDGEKSIKS